MHKILITGANGFVGRHFVNFFSEKGKSIVTLSKEDGTHIDLNNQEEVHAAIQRLNPDSIIHLAAIASVTEYMPIEYYQVNVIGTENILLGLKGLGKKRILFFSSAAIYGDQNTTILDESMTPQPVSHYGLSKLCAEHLMTAAMKNHDITILRPFNIIGSDQKDYFIVPKLIKHFAHKAPVIELGNIKPERDYINLATVCRVVEKIMEIKQTYGETINICSGVGTSIVSMIAHLEQISSFSPEISVQKNLVRENEIWRLVGNTQKLKKFVPDIKLDRPILETLQELYHEVIQNSGKVE